MTNMAMKLLLDMTYAKSVTMISYTISDQMDVIVRNLND